MLRRVILPQLLIATALSLLSSAPIPAQFKLGIDSQAQNRTPKGTVLEKVWKSQVITDTVRRYWVYVPAQYNSKHKTAVMVFQDGSKDLDNAHGNWWLANQQMAKALAFSSYDFRFVSGDGGHSGKHGGAILPSALRWLWRGWQGKQPGPYIEIISAAEFSHSSDSLLITPGNEEGVARDLVAIAFPAEQAPQKRKP